MARRAAKTITTIGTSAVDTGKHTHTQIYQEYSTANTSMRTKHRWDPKFL